MLLVIALGLTALLHQHMSDVLALHVFFDARTSNAVNNVESELPPAEVYSVGGWLNYTLTVQEGVWTLPRGISFETRLYNGVAPSPVLHAAPGERVRLLVQNRLGSNIATHNDVTKLGFRQANTTNLHLHGIYDDAKHDDTFARVHPGSEKLYSYHLEPRSGSSLIYYHPHADGATALQSVGGMGGVLVITDETQEAALALPAVATRALLLQAFNLDPTNTGDYVGTQLANGGSSTLGAAVRNPTGFQGTLLVVNGADAPREQLPAGGWLRLQLVNAVTGGYSSVHLGFGPPARSDVEACMLTLLAYDGVWLNTPRAVPSMLLPPGGRAEVLVGCAASGTHVFGSLGSSALGGTLPAGGAVVVLDVEADATGGGEGGDDVASVAATMVSMLARLPRALPGPPEYYRADISSARVAPHHQHSLVFSSSTGLNVINERAYNTSHVEMHMEIGAVVEWTLIGAESPGTLLKLHPYHQHFCHFQIVEVVDTGADGGGGGDALELLPLVGEWRDTIPLYGRVRYKIRFVAPFSGLLTVHCHIQKHSENGMMTLARIA